MTQLSKKEQQVPSIESEEDKPFQSFTSENNSQNMEELRQTNDDIESKRFSLGSNMLGWGLFLMFLCVVLSLFQPNNNIISTAFDAFRLIVMTILGYIFGSNNKQ